MPATTDVYAYPEAQSRNVSVHNYLLPAIVSALDACGAKVVLDLGCGNGALGAMIAESGRTVYGCDTSESGVSHAAVNLGRGRAKVASAEEPIADLFPGVQFDAIVSAEVVEHLYNPGAFVRSAHAALQTGASLIVTTPYHGWLKDVALAVSGKMSSHYTPLWDGGHIKFWHRATLTKLLEDNGFRVVSFEGVGRAPWLWKSMVLRAVKL